MTTDQQPVVEHYAANDLMGRIRNALANAGLDPEKMTVQMLSQLDHLHGGGLATTEAQAEVAEIPKGCHVLDAGCGIGGPSRFLAEHYGCTVEAIDLTPEYTDAAEQLNAQVGLADRISLRTGSVTDLPYPDESFDVVLCQNVSMNVADKAAMFSEAFRVLKPGGIYTLSHLADGPNAPPIYPLPWARRPEVSFLGEPQEFLELLANAGFSDIQDRAPQASSQPAAPQPPNIIGAIPAMGDDMPERLKNTQRSMQEGRLIAMMVVARRPA